MSAFIDETLREKLKDVVTNESALSFMHSEILLCGTQFVTDESPTELELVDVAVRIDVYPDVLTIILEGIGEEAEQEFVDKGTELARICSGIIAGFRKRILVARAK